MDGGYAQIPSGYLPGWAPTYLEYHIPGTKVFYAPVTTYGDSRYLIGINANTKNVEACLAYLDMLADPEAYLNIIQGPDGEFWYLTEAGTKWFEDGRNDASGFTLSNGETLEMWNSPFLARNGTLTRFGDGKGGYRLITGNEMGIILLDYICRTRKALGTMPEHPVAVTTIVSTDMATPVAAKYGVELRRTLTGFKFIGEQIGLLEAAGEADRYIFGFEESYGYLSGAHVRDKDAVNATLLVCEAAAWYAKQGMTLLDAINQLYAEFGCYRNALHSFAFEGESGMHTMDAIMKQLRQTPPTAIGGMAVESLVDYNTAGTGLPKANVLEFRLAGGAKLMVRPSGTEPKIKVYLSAVAPTEEAADAINDTLGKAASALLKA